MPTSALAVFTVSGSWSTAGDHSAVQRGVRQTTCNVVSFLSSARGRAFERRMTITLGVPVSRPMAVRACLRHQRACLVDGRHRQATGSARH